MQNNNKILVGKIVAPQGIRGEMRVQTYTAAPTDLKDMKIESTEFDGTDFQFVRRLNPTSNVIIARIRGINDRNAAEEMRGVELYVSRDTLPPTKDGEYYQADLIGFVVERDGKIIGQIDGFQNFGAGDIMELDNGYMVSFAGAEVDLENKTVKV